METYLIEKIHFFFIIMRHQFRELEIWKTDQMEILFFFFWDFFAAKWERRKIREDGNCPEGWYFLYQRRKFWLLVMLLCQLVRLIDHHPPWYIRQDLSKRLLTGLWPATIPEEWHSFRRKVSSRTKQPYFSKGIVLISLWGLPVYSFTVLYLEPMKLFLRSGWTPSILERSALSW